MSKSDKWLCYLCGQSAQGGTGRPGKLACVGCVKPSKGSGKHWRSTRGFGYANNRPRTVGTQTFWRELGHAGLVWRDKGSDPSLCEFRLDSVEWSDKALEALEKVVRTDSKACAGLAWLCDPDPLTGEAGEALGIVLAWDERQRNVGPKPEPKRSKPKAKPKPKARPAPVSKPIGESETVGTKQPPPRAERPEDCHALPRYASWVPCAPLVGWIAGTESSLAPPPPPPVGKRYVW